MQETDNKDAFDRLVAGLSAEERMEMLGRINQNAPSAVQFVDTEEKGKDSGLTLKFRLENESVFYKIYLLIRSLFSKQTKDRIYNDDLISRIAHKINKDHPGIVLHHSQVLDSVFYERLKTLKEVADFFKPYFSFVDSAPGDFYVFLSSFVVPELSDSINKTADPYILPFTKNPTPDVKTELLHKLDEILNGIDGTSKSKLYYAISSLNWLKLYTKLPFLHFTSQFTNIAGNSYTCPYKNAINDYDAFAALFANITPVNNEALEALYLFSQKKELTSNAQSKDVERAVREFMATANSHLATIQMFISGVPVVKVGKVVNHNYDWQPGNIEGVEAWFPSFRSHWRRILDVRWNDWVRERKKNLLSNNLRNDFNLTSFPEMLYHPWTSLWARVPFAYELTSGFLSWFATDKYDEVINTLNDILLEGIFLKSDNRTEYSEGLNLFVQANKQMKELLDKLSPGGSYGSKFEEFSTNTVRTLQVQNQITSMMHGTESEIHEIIEKFQKGAKQITAVFRGFFDEQKDGIHEGLQNWGNMKGHQNREFKDEIRQIRDLIKKCIFYISELEPIDAATRSE